MNDPDETLTADSRGLPATSGSPSRHQNCLPPTENKFHIGNGEDGKHYWLTPPDLYAELNAEFHFDFDPCPYPKPDSFDGLTCEWGQRNYVNPPFGYIMHNGRKKGPTAWMRKAIEEQRKGKLSVVVYPVDKWVLMMLAATGAVKVRNLGDVRWHAIEDGSQGKGTGRHIAAFIIEPRRAPAATKANARLMAAAPDLLAVCERVLTFLTDRFGNNSGDDWSDGEAATIGDMIDAAIATATTGQNNQVLRPEGSAATPGSKT